MFIGTQQRRKTHSSSNKRAAAGVVLVMSACLFIGCAHAPTSGRHDDFFSPDYTTARSRFREAVTKADGRLTSLDLTAKGPGGEDLTIDIGWFGSSHPKRVLLHSSGVHGVEAFTGSAIQLKWLSEGLTDIPDDAAVIIVHVLNPYGMAWLRRFNERNVDLNRNFLEAPDEWAGKSPDYDLVDSLLNPTDIGSPDFFTIRLMWLRLRLGGDRLRQTVSSQYEEPEGLFYGGSELEEGPSLYKAWLRKNFDSTDRLFVVDVHTGLGKWGRNSLFYKIKSMGDENLPDELRENIVPDFESSPVVGYGFRGGHVDIHRQLFGNIRVDFITQEFGTYSGAKVLKALRSENQQHHHGDASIDHPSKIKLKEAFFPSSLEWRAGVLEDGMELVRAMARCLREDKTVLNEHGQESGNNSRPRLKNQED